MYYGVSELIPMQKKKNNNKKKKIIIKIKNKIKK